MIKYTLALAALLLITPAPAQPVWEAKDGILIMESEATTSSKGKWKERKTVDGYTGDSHLEFTGNTPNGGKPTSSLKYRFTVDKDGVYHLRIRAHKRLQGERGDKARNDQCNDCYVQLKGKYEPANGIPAKILKEDTKLFIHGKSAVTWDWTNQLDYHDPKTKKEAKRDPQYTLKAGEKYTLVISGRSQRFNMDRIVLWHDEADENAARNPGTSESKKR